MKTIYNLIRYCHENNISIILLTTSNKYKALFKQKVYQEIYPNDNVYIRTTADIQKYGGLY